MRLQNQGEFLHVILLKIYAVVWQKTLCWCVKCMECVMAPILGPHRRGPQMAPALQTNVNSLALATPLRSWHVMFEHASAWTRWLFLKFSGGVRGAYEKRPQRIAFFHWVGCEMKPPLVAIMCIIRVFKWIFPISKKTRANLGGEKLK